MWKRLQLTYLFIENGRVGALISTDHRKKTGFKKIAEFFDSIQTQGHFRLTGNQHVLDLCVEDENLNTVKELMKTYKLGNTNFSGHYLLLLV